MPATEEQLHKLKVTELKELLAKHNLVQTGKKDDLIKRLLENSVSVDNEEQSQTAPPAAPSSEQPPSTNGTTKPPSSKEPQVAPSTSEPSSSSLTPQQQALKARAERFGMPFNPNAAPSTSTSTSNSNPSASAATKPAKAETSTSSTTPAPSTTLTAGSKAIDKAPLGISEEQLAKRAARFGIPGKKVEPPKEPPTQKALKTADPELSPEAAAKVAEEEEKKRKRAEKFGLVKPESAVNGTSPGPEAKKAKV